jgi:ubiquinone/menaquinone biosynthesis C-methylase UbiE
LQIESLKILDVGSGAGDLTRYMTRHGATVTGLECGPAQLEKARNTPLEGSETYIEGYGQDLPFQDATFDVAIFFNSLHHIPPEFMAMALTEATRVTKPSGILYIAEPLVSGTGFELHKPIDDETVVRASALQALIEIGKTMASSQEITYITSYHYQDYDDFRDESIRIDITRQFVFDERDDEFRIHFDNLGISDDKGYRFDQNMRVNILHK